MKSMVKSDNSISLNTAIDVFSIQINELNKVKDRLGMEIIQAAEFIFNSQGRVIVTGIGKSGLIGKKIAATLASTGTHASFMNSAEGLHGDLGMIVEQDIVIAISNSGNSDEVIALIPSIKRIGAKIIAMTGNKKSILAQVSDVVLDIGVEHEACPLNLAPTSSATAALVMGDALAIILMKMRDFRPENFAVYHPGGTLGRRLLTKVDDVMHSNEAIPSVTQYAEFEQIVYEMSNKRLGAVCVTRSGVIQGIITDGDIRRAIEKYKKSLFDMKASQLMTERFMSINSSAMAIEALEIMEKKKISCLPVVDCHELVGFITLHDVFNIK